LARRRRRTARVGSTRSCSASAASPPTRRCVLAVALGTSERFWLGLQADFDLEQAHRALGKKIGQLERIAA